MGLINRGLSKSLHIECENCQPTPTCWPEELRTLEREINPHKQENKTTTKTTQRTIQKDTLNAGNRRNFKTT